MEDCAGDQELSWDYDKLGQADFRLKYFDMALENYDKALCIRRFRAENNPTELGFKRDIAYTRERMGRAYAAKQHWMATDDAFIEVIRSEGTL